MNTDFDNSMFDEILSVIESLREDPEDQSQETNEPGKKEKLLSAVKEKIAHEAQKRNFVVAEAYRKKLADIAPDLLKDLYETGLIIAIEKRKARRNFPATVNDNSATMGVENHWARLEKHFSDEEYAAFLNILTPVAVDKLTDLVEPDQMNDRLFLIHMGSVHIYFKADGLRLALKKLGAGSICGVDTFMYGNASNTFIEAAKGTRMDYLEKTKLASLTATYPTIEDRLINYIHHCENDIDGSQINDLEMQMNTYIETPEIREAKKTNVKQRRMHAERESEIKDRPQQKTSPVTQNHWANLQNIFTKEEYAAFLNLMTPVSVEKLTMLVKSDQMNDRLFLIHQGTVYIYFKVNGQKSIFKTLGAGSICGVDTFLSGNVSSAFIEADKGARFDYVEKAQLAGLAITYPAIEDHLVDYIYQCENDIDDSYLNGLGNSLNKRAEAAEPKVAHVTKRPVHKASGKAGSRRAEKATVSSYPYVIQSHWANLENFFSEEEQTAFLNLLTSVFFEKRTNLVEPGRMNNKLFLIQQGSINIYSNANGKKTISRKFGPGSICGVDTFTYGHVANTYIQATPGTHIDYISKVTLSRLIAQYPTIKNRLIRWLFTCDSDIDCSQMSSLNRRLYKRFTAFGIIDAQVLEPGKESGKVISGRLLDISHKGLAFQIETSHANPGKILKGKKANVVMEIEHMNPRSELFWGGAIVGVTALNELRYSIHLHGEQKSDTIASLLEQLYTSDRKKSL